MTLRVGLQLWNQVFSWEKAREAAKRAEEFRYDSLRTWEHALACMRETGLATAE